MSFLYAAILILSLSAPRVWAACSSPAANAGNIQWISASSKVMWCDGSNWIDPANGTGASCSGTPAGTINYSSGEHRFCNGTNWISMKGPSAGSCSGTTAGTMTYNSGSNKVRFCDGSNWYDATAACAGVSFGGYCWYMGTSGASCDTICGGHGATCVSAGVIAYGSGGTNTDCGNLLTALSQAGGAVGNSAAYDTGCVMVGGLRFRNTLPTTCAAAAVGGLRTCSCSF
jgi:hypothetical protein